MQSGTSSGKAWWKSNRNRSDTLKLYAPGPIEQLATTSRTGVGSSFCRFGLVTMLRKRNKLVPRPSQPTSNASRGIASGRFSTRPFGPIIDRKFLLEPVVPVILPDRQSPSIFPALRLCILRGLRSLTSVEVTAHASSSGVWPLETPPHPSRTRFSYVASRLPRHPRKSNCFPRNQNRSFASIVAIRRTSSSSWKRATCWLPRQLRFLRPHWCR